ncbi:MAG TPA: EamA family transporter, partial [Rhodobacteraceae bacterium]|nr:EamA family transporter [Paracoccaceae bacterium]
MSQNNARLGILLMIATTFVFALQDGISRHLAGEYNPVMVVMVRYWFFASFVVVYAMRKSGGFRAAVRTTQLPLQIFRGFLLAGEIIVALISFVYLGLVQTHAIFASYPLMVAALAGPVLGEKVGWRRWVAIGVGFVGMLVVLQPGATVFSPYMLVAILSSLMFAVYGLLTRFVARKDSAMTSFFWTGVAGCAFMTVIGVWFWEPMIGFDWVWMGILCLTGAGGHLDRKSTRLNSSHGYISY